ncbi:hypothetical protein JB92DRAFT_403623 [Gautieria morchelliformis]|nr:hypothetical protein JB92DRAFT_403623 [Gautieria morchelliformis]
MIPNSLRRRGRESSTQMSDLPLTRMNLYRFYWLLHAIHFSSLCVIAVIAILFQHVPLRLHGWHHRSPLPFCADLSPSGLWVSPPFLASVGSLPSPTLPGCLSLCPLLSLGWMRTAELDEVHPWCSYIALIHVAFMVQLVDGDRLHVPSQCASGCRSRQCLLGVVFVSRGSTCVASSSCILYAPVFPTPLARKSLAFHRAKKRVF